MFGKIGKFNPMSFAKMAAMMSPYGQMLQGAMAAYGAMEGMSRKGPMGMSSLGKEAQGFIGDNPWTADFIADDSRNKVMAQSMFSGPADMSKVGLGDALSSLGDGFRQFGQLGDSKVLEQLAQMMYGEANPNDNVGQSLSEKDLKKLFMQAGRLLGHPMLTQGQKAGIQEAMNVLSSRIDRGPGMDGSTDDFDAGMGMGMAWGMPNWGGGHYDV